MTTNLTPEEAKQWLASGEVTLIDVREPDEFKAEHIPFALSLPLGSLPETFKLLNLPPERKVIFQCFKGSRGQQACTWLEAAPGNRNPIYNITGGITGWKEAGLPTIKGGSGAPPIFRQVQAIVGGLVLIAVIIGFAGVFSAFAVAGFFGAALLFAGMTGWCGLAMLLGKMPWNR